MAVVTTCGWSSSRSLKRSARSWVAASTSRSWPSWREHRVQRGPGVVVGVVADVLDPAHRLDVDALGDGLVEPRRCPPGGPLAEHLHEGVRVVHQPPVHLVEAQVDHAVVEVVAHHLGEQGPEQRRDGFLAEARHEGVGHQVGDVLVADLAEGDRGDVGDLVDDAPGVGGVGEPVPDPRRDGRRGHPVADDVLLEEVLPHELLQALAQLVLALGDQRGVRDRARPSGCLKSAVTANQSAMAPTMEASAPALTNPQKPSCPASRRTRRRRGRGGTPRRSASGAGPGGAPRRHPGRA